MNNDIENTSDESDFGISFIDIFRDLIKNKFYYLLIIAISLSLSILYKSFSEVQYIAKLEYYQKHATHISNVSINLKDKVEKSLRLGILIDDDEFYKILAKNEKYKAKLKMDSTSSSKDLNKFKTDILKNIIIEENYIEMKTFEKSFSVDLFKSIFAKLNKVTREDLIISYLDKKRQLEYQISTYEDLDRGLSDADLIAELSKVSSIGNDEDQKFIINKIIEYHLVKNKASSSTQSELISVLLQLSELDASINKLEGVETFYDYNINAIEFNPTNLSYLSLIQISIFFSFVLIFILILINNVKRKITSL